MGRKSALTDKQWAQIEKRLIDGEACRRLADEFKISEAAIRKRFGSRIKQIKDVANQLVTAEAALRSLPIGAQISARTLADELRDMSGHLAGAGRLGAATAHRLSGIAHAKVLEIDDASPLGEESIASLRGVAVLTKLANDSSQIAINILAANKEMVKGLNSGAITEPGQLLAELVGHLPD